MDSIEIKIGEHPVKFTSKSVSFSGSEYFYGKMSNIVHCDGPLPYYEFTYNGQQEKLFYTEKSEKAVHKVFHQIIALQKKKAAENPPTVQTEPQQDPEPYNNAETAPAAETETVPAAEAQEVSEAVAAAEYPEPTEAETVSADEIPPTAVRAESVEAIETELQEAVPADQAEPVPKTGSAPQTSAAELRRQALEGIQPQAVIQSTAQNPQETPLQEAEPTPEPFTPEPALQTAPVSEPTSAPETTNEEQAPEASTIRTETPPAAEPTATPQTPAAAQSEQTAAPAQVQAESVPTPQADSAARENTSVAVPSVTPPEGTVPTDGCLVSETELNQKSNNTKKTVPIIVAVVVVIAAIIAGIAFFQGKEEKAPAPESTAAPVTTTAAAEKGSYEAGTYKVGVDLPEGIYLIEGSGYLSVSSDNSNSLESVVTNANYTNRTFIQVSKQQYLNFEGKATPADKAEAYANTETLTDGMYLVGKDLPAGEYTAVAKGDAYIAIMTDAKGLIDSIKENFNFSETQTITVQDGQFLEMRNCDIDLTNGGAADNADGTTTETETETTAAAEAEVR